MVRAQGPNDPAPSGAGLFWAAWLVSAAVCAALLFVPGYPGDVVHYKYWTRLVTLGGIGAAYSGTYPETYAIYPPITLYAYGIVGLLYRLLVDPSFDVEAMLASQALSVGIKAVAITFHLALGFAIYRLTRARANGRVGALTAALYLLNPAAIFDVAYWGQPDAAHSLWAVLAFGLLDLGRDRAGAVAFGLAAMTKPQAWALFPLFVYAAWLRTGRRRTVTGLALIALTAAVVALPFLLAGRLGDFLTLPEQIASTMPVASAFAHNLWWLVTRGTEPLVFDREALIGLLSYRDVAGPMVLLVAAIGLWRLRRAPSDGLFLIAAYQAFGWFCLTTRAHENHAFFVLPLLAMALPTVPWARVLFAGITLTLFLNMALHDPLLAPRLQALAAPDTLWRLQMANASLNLLMLAGWTALLLRPSLGRLATHSGTIPVHRLIRGPAPRTGQSTAPSER